MFRVLWRKKKNIYWHSHICLAYKDIGYGSATYNHDLDLVRPALSRLRQAVFCCDLAVKMLYKRAIK